MLSLMLSKITIDISPSFDSFFMESFNYILSSLQTAGLRPSLTLSLYTVAAVLGVLLGLRTTSINSSEGTGRGNGKYNEKSKKRSSSNAAASRGRSNSSTPPNRRSSSSSSKPFTTNNHHQTMEEYNEENIMALSPIGPDTPLTVVFENNKEEAAKYSTAEDILISLGQFFANDNESINSQNSKVSTDVPLPKFKEIASPLSPDRELDEDLLLPFDNGRKNGRPLSSIIRADSSSSRPSSPCFYSSTSSLVSPSSTTSLSSTFRRCSERISERGINFFGRKKGYWKDFYGGTSVGDLSGGSEDSWDY